MQDSKALEMLNLVGFRYKAQRIKKHKLQKISWDL